MATKAHQQLFHGMQPVTGTSSVELLVRKPSLHIAMVTETYPPEVNGVAKTLHHMVNGMLERGHELQLVRPRQHAEDRGSSGFRNSVLETVVGSLPVPGYRGLHLGLWCRGRLESVWMKRRPDVIYIATEGLLGHSALAAATSLRVPVITGFHTNFDHYSRYYRIGFLESAIRAVLRRFHNRAQCTLVPTSALRDRLQAQGFGKCRVMARGVDIARFAPQKRDSELRRSWGLRDGELAVMHVGRLAAEKNLGLAIESFRAIQVVAPGARMIMVGDGPETEGLRRSHPDVIFAGMRSGEDLARHYASGDLFLFPSLTDTFGNVVLEAMASGLPVVAFNDAAAREHVREGQTGSLAAFGDHADFIDRAVKLATAPRDLVDMGVAARATAETLDWVSEHERLETLFLEYASQGATLEARA